MSTDIRIRVRDWGKCPCCGERIPGDVVHTVCASGSGLSDIRKDINYTNDMYGKDVLLSDEQAQKVVLGLSDHYYTEESRQLAFDIVAGRIMEFSADW